MIKVLVVDDHDLVCLGITSMLEGIPTFNVVGTANSGEQAYALASQLEPHVILMDIRMPGMGGLEATRKIIERLPNTKIIAVTACEDQTYLERLFEVGAKGFLTKGAPPEELICAINKVIKNELYLSPEHAERLALSHLTNAPECPFSTLSGRELEVCLMIAQGHKPQELSDLFCVSPKTINTYRYRAFEKLAIDSDVKLTHLAIKHGLIEVQS
ncbi:response regulator [Thiopseudomonas alkaliphila]|uniref:response regulator n=1 Tax=Thiopseudomonas alkaliphila TaxID=1697053 RepID=UPI00257882E7|nr:response regulator [Thiopseudomonas alkaliphila]MDM1707006.1 response regulator [Thiopseudomonas alkaliphila]